MLYLDSNIFISALISGSQTGKACKNLLDVIIDNKIKGITCALTFDEVLWKLKSIMGYENAIDTTEKLLDLPIKIIPVDALVVREALGMARNYKLKPRDAIHTASMKLGGIKEICSTDPDFDAIIFVKRILPEKVEVS